MNCRQPVHECTYSFCDIDKLRVGTVNLLTGGQKLHVTYKRWEPDNNKVRICLDCAETISIWLFPVPTPDHARKRESYLKSVARQIVHLH